MGAQTVRKSPRKRLPLHNVLHLTSFGSFESMHDVICMGVFGTLGWERCIVEGMGHS